MDRRVAGALWGILALLAFGLAPPARPDWAAWCGRLVSGDWAGEDPAIVAHFQVMGVWPLAWAVLLRRDLRARPLPAWPFVLGSMALGALALLPWFVLRPATQRPAEEGWIERALVHPLLLAAGGGAGLGWLAWGALAGDPGVWLARARSEGFVFTMTWDFLRLWAASVLQLRGAPGAAWAAVPVAGAFAAARSGEGR